MSRRGYKWVSLILAVVLIVCIGLLVRRSITKNQASETYEKLADTVNQVSTEATEEEVVWQDSEMEEDTEAVSIPEKNLDWEMLKKENEDIYAWIYVPGTQIDYPVLQHPSNDNYYLGYNLDGSPGYPGCIFSQSYNRKDFTDPLTVLYGHNMKNGSMFGDLHEFEDNEFFEENSYIYIYTSEKNLVYEIFSACAVSDELLLYKYDTTTEKGMQQFIEDMTNVREMNAHVRSEVQTLIEDHYLTLSTCIKGKSNQRWLVNGVLVEED